MIGFNRGKIEIGLPKCEGLGAWLLQRFNGRLSGHGRDAARLALVERISLAPRQSLALVEAEGRRFLVATSPDGGPAFYALDLPSIESSSGPTVRLDKAIAPAVCLRTRSRVSW